jgi:hypothetical protein
MVLHRSPARLWAVVGFALALVGALALAGSAHAAGGKLKPRAFGELDCNGQSTIQTSVRRSFACTDIRGFAGASNANTWDARFYDNGVYIGHDEPDMTFLSTKAGSGDNVTWTETLPRDPSAAPTIASPGSDVSHWFELSIAPWFSMAMCDPLSYPQNGCTPEGTTAENAPTCVGTQTTNCYPGAGSAFMEMQLYPPGFPPFADGISCDDSHWCAALTIDSLECTLGFAYCNPGCTEPVNFGWIQRDGVPTGPPSPQDADLQTFTPNGETLFMSPGDTIRVHMFDAPAPGGGDAFEVVIDDLTTGQSGFMQASAHNGFADTSITDCSGTPFNFQPEYSTAAKSDIVPWAALQTDISTEFETGHWEGCTGLSHPATLTLAPGVTDTYYNSCHSPYETFGKSESSEPSDALCYPQGDTHGSLASQPDLIAGCLDDLQQNGDLDFDGTPYWAEWPTGSQPTAKLPGSFVESLPSSSAGGYQQYFVQTDVALSESTCSSTSAVGCSVPPPGPGQFYPYWSRVGTATASCTLEFGNVASGAGVDNLGQDAQYGADQIQTLGYPEFEGPIQANTCGSSG